MERLNELECINTMKELDIKVGYACNNACVFCLNKDKRDFKAYPIKVLKNQIKRSVNKGCQKLIISGGEPLISKNFFKLLEFAKSSGINVIEVQTNGRMLYYEEFIKKINAFKSISFLVSFHFPNSALYKKYSRSDGFSQVMGGIKNLIKHGYIFNVNTVVMKLNMDYLKEIVEVLKNIGVKNIQYRFIDGKNILSEHGKEEYKKFVPKYAEVTGIIREIVSQNKDINIRLNEFPVCVIGEDLVNNLAPATNKERENLSLGNKVFMSNEIMKKQFVFPNCDGCLYRSTCKGIRKEYYKIYGAKEITPIIKTK